MITGNRVLSCVSPLRPNSYDLMKACKDIGEGKLHVPELLGEFKIEPISQDGAYDVKLDSKRVQNERVLQLLQRYTHRKSFYEK